MKTLITVTELSHEDLVNILSTALYGSDWLQVDYDRKAWYDRKTWEAIPSEKKEGDCFEDHLADMLLNGHTIELTDIESDGELHKVRGVPCRVRKEQSIHNPNESYEVSVYMLNLKAILKACSSPRGYELVTKTLSDEGDYFTANNLLQIALFGEEIYG